jgi:bacillithiol biosynthesis cysteine-adding enzyme BshC
MNSSMESHCLSFSELPHTTKLFSQFIDHFDRISRYYAHPPSKAGVIASAKKIALDPAVRRSVVEILREQNQRLGAGASTFKSLDRLASGACAIVSGQQVGLFSGPAYSFYKALSAVRWAAEISRRTAAVPVFWLATEDHDLAEVNHVFWNGRKGLGRFELPIAEKDAGKSVGTVKLGNAILSLVSNAAEGLEGPFADEVTRALGESYAPGETYGSAFGKLMARLLEDRGIIFLDPLDERLHQLSSAIYRLALDQSDAIRTGLAARSKELENGGFHAQVKIPRESTLLFLNIGGQRLPLRRRNGNFIAGDRIFAPAELYSLLERSPELFTPNVLLRPVVQDILLPTAAYIGGPAEVAYMAQAQVVYETLLGRMPAILARPGFTLVEPGVERILKKYKLDLRGVLKGRQMVRSKMELESLPRGLNSRFEKDEKILRRLLGDYAKPLERLDRTLTGSRMTAERKILHQFTKLKAKAGRAENARTGILDRHERLLLDALCPHRELQERSLCFLPFLAAGGPELLDRLSSGACDSHCKLSPATHHQILFL